MDGSKCGQRERRDFFFSTSLAFYLPRPFCPPRNILASGLSHVLEGVQYMTSLASVPLLLLYCYLVTLQKLSASHALFVPYYALRPFMPSFGLHIRWFVIYMI